MMRDATDGKEEFGEIILEVADLRTHLYTSRGIVKAVDGISFNLRRGETLGIVGESGSGKSMTGLSILRLEPKPAAEIVSGEVLFRGQDLLKKSEKEMRMIRGAKISMILQDPQTSLNPVFTVGHQVMEALKIHGLAKDPKDLRNRGLGLLREVNIADPERRINDYPHQMSGGMKQRIVGAISISCEPEIIIADEPTTSLDLTIQAQYLRLLKAIQKNTGVSIIFITHDFGVVARMCDRVVVMYAGRIVEHGSVRALLDKPSHPYTQALIHSVPRIDRRVERLYSLPGQPPMPGENLVGCPFAPRCKYVEARCEQTYPPRLPGLSKESDHVADCWKLEEHR